MPPLRIKDIEGDARDVQDLLVSHSINLQDYINPPSKSHKIHFFWIPGISVLFFILNCFIWNNTFNKTWNNVAILGVFTLLVAIIICFHLKFDNRGVTAMVFLFGILIIAISIGAMQPKEAVDEVKKRLPVIGVPNQQ